MINFEKTLVKNRHKKVAMPATNKAVLNKTSKVLKSIPPRISFMAKTAPFLAFSMVNNETKLTSILTVFMPPIKIKKE